MRLLLIRHGQTTSNVDLLLDTAVPGADLTDLGRKQAAAIPGALAAVDIDLVVASDLVRTQQTAQPLAEARGLTPWVRGGIREISAGDLEMRGDEEALIAYHEMVVRWSEDLDFTVPGGETGAQMLQRYDQVIAEAHEAVGDEGTAVFVSHGSVIRTWSALRMDGVDGEWSATHLLANTALVAARGRPGRWTLESWGMEPLGDGEPIPA